MDDSIVIDLLQNVAVLLAFAMLYENFWLRKCEAQSFICQLIAGAVIGGIGIVLMFTPWTFTPGIVFDTRSIMLSVSGLFFGPIPTVTAVIIDAAVRFFIGGDGTWMGITVIIFSGAIGLAWRRFRFHDKLTYKPLEFLALGAMVHILMMAATLLLPEGQIVPTLRAIVLPVCLIYIPGTMLFGMLLATQAKNYQNRKAKSELRKVEHQLSQILKSNNIVSIIFDENLNVTFCNKYLLELTGFSREELTHGIWDKMFQNIPGRKEFIKNGKEAMLSDTDGDSVEIPISAKNGSVHIISLYCARFFDAKNNFAGAACIGVNVTDSIRYENQLHKQIEKFTSLNKKYLAQNKDLQYAKEKAEESDRLKSAFLANLSHEIRTPLNAILGFTDLLKIDELDAGKRAYFADIIQNSGQYLLSIITDIIEISHIEAGQVRLTNSNINPCIFCEDIYNSFKAEIPKDSGIQFELELPEKTEGIAFTSDEAKLRQTVLNLLKNALKFSDEGTITLGCKLENDFLNIYVKDTGIGIDAQYQDIIFERFRQVETENSKMRGGSGLGLTISKAYIEMMGGHIALQSAPGEGSVFTCRFPVETIGKSLTI